MEIFLAPKVAAKRAMTFQINVAVTNFAPERIVSDKRGSAADKCIRIETKEKEKTWEGEGCHHGRVVAMPVLMCSSCAGSRQEGKLRVRTEHLEVCRHFRAGISINDNLCQYAFYRNSVHISGM